MKLERKWTEKRMLNTEHSKDLKDTDSPVKKKSRAL